MSAVPKPVRFDNAAEIIRYLGVSGRRIRVDRLGIAREKDLLSLHHQTDRLFELIDAFLVEKVLDFQASALTCKLISLLGSYLDKHSRGFLTGPDGPVRLRPGLVALPDISFISWKQLPKRERPTDPIADLAPALAVEVLSKGNTKREMDRKVREYFVSGVRLVWLVSPASRSVSLYTAPDEATTLTEDQTLTGGDVLPGLSLPLRRVFAEVPVETKTARRPKRRRPNGGERPA